MKIIVMGAGPIGGIIGGRLARAGNDVTLVDVDAEQVQAVRESGLQIDVPDGPFTVPVTILFPDEVEGKFDIAFIAVRSYHAKEVVDFLAQHLTETAILVSLQNGINPPFLEYDPWDFHPSRSSEARMAAFDQMARRWKSDDRKGAVRQLKRGARTEVDQTIGHVVREGRRLGLPTPLCQSAMKMIHEMEQGTRPLAMENYTQLAGAMG